MPRDQTRGWSPAESTLAPAGSFRYRKKPPVGRGSPPHEHQFGANKPGNRRGRAKGSKNVKTIVRNIAQEKHAIKEGEATIELTTVELLFRMLTIKAMNGDIRADKFIDRFLDRQSPPSGGGGYLLAPELQSVEEWVEQAEKLNSLLESPLLKSGHKEALPD